MATVELNLSLRSLQIHPKQRNGTLIQWNGCLQDKAVTTVSLARYYKAPCKQASKEGAGRGGSWGFTRSTPTEVPKSLPSSDLSGQLYKTQRLHSSPCPHTKDFASPKADQRKKVSCRDCPLNSRKTPQGDTRLPAIGSWPAGPGNYHKQCFQKIQLTLDYPSEQIMASSFSFGPFNVSCRI